MLKIQLKKMLIIIIINFFKIKQDKTVWIKKLFLENSDFLLQCYLLRKLERVSICLQFDSDISMCVFWEHLNMSCNVAWNIMQRLSQECELFQNTRTSLWKSWRVSHMLRKTQLLLFVNWTMLPVTSAGPRMERIWNQTRGSYLSSETLFLKAIFFVN